MRDAARVFGLSDDQLAGLLGEASDDHRSAAPDLVDRAVVEERLRYVGLPDEVIGAVLIRLPAIADSLDAAQLIAVLLKRVFPESQDAGGDPSAWPTVDDADDLIGIAYLLVAIAMVPQVRATHRRLGIPESVTRATCGQISAFCLNHRTGHAGKPGIMPRQLYWLRHYPAGRLFRIGRFEYTLSRYSHAGPVVRRGPLTMAFADPALWVRGDGRTIVDEPAAGNVDAQGSEEAFKPILTVDEETIAGNPIEPNGVVLKAPVRVHRAEWSTVLEDGDPVLDMHIPAGGGMRPDLVRQSMSDAFDFFDTYFPDRRARAVVCRSWIFNTQVEERIPDGNLAAFMREAYLVPTRSSGRDGLFFVFCRDYGALENYPRDTRLRRALVEILEEGDSLRTTGMFFLRDDLPRFGEQTYRGDWRAVMAAVERD